MTWICKKCQNVSAFKLWKCNSCWSFWTMIEQVEEKRQKKEKEIHSYKTLWNVLQPKKWSDFKNYQWNEEFLKIENTELLRVFELWNDEFIF